MIREEVIQELHYYLNSIQCNNISGRQTYALNWKIEATGRLRCTEKSLQVLLLREIFTLHITFNTMSSIQEVRQSGTYHPSAYMVPCTEAATKISLRSCPGPQISSLVADAPSLPLASALRTIKSFAPDGEGTMRAAPLSSKGKGDQW